MIETNYSSFDEFWIPFLLGQGPAGNYLPSLDQNQKNQIRERVQESVPISDDGEINLIATAFATKGKK